MVDSFQPMDCSLPDSSVHGISQARILEWVAISFFRGSSWPRDGTRIFCIGRQILYHRATWASLRWLWLTGLVAPWRVGSSLSRDQAHVFRFGRRILYHGASRKGQCFFKDIDPLLQSIFSKGIPQTLSIILFSLLSRFPLFLYIYASFVCNFPVIICDTMSSTVFVKFRKAQERLVFKPEYLCSDFYDVM